MKKTRLFILCVSLCLLSCTGCSNGNTTTSSLVNISSDSISSNSTSSVVVSSDNTSSSNEVSYVSMLPDISEIFGESEINVTDPDGGKAYMVQVTNYTEEQYDSFVAECKELTFKTVSYETKYDKGCDFGAYSEDNKYWVQVNMDKTKNIIYIICQTSKK